MKKIYFLMCTFLMAFSVLAEKPTKENLKLAELGRFNAMIAGEQEGLDKCLHNDLYYCHSSADVDNKESYIQSITSKKTVYNKIDIVENNARIYGKIGIMTGILNIVNLKNNEPQPVNKLRYTSVYLHEGGRWQMVSWQSTKILK